MEDSLAPKPGRAWRAFRAALAVYTWSAVAALFLRATTGDWLPPVTAFSQLMHLALLPAPFLLVAALVGSRWRSAVGLSIDSAAFVWCCSAWLPVAPGEPVDPPEESLVVLTWNLGAGLADVAEVERAIRSVDPDFVALQEASEGSTDVLVDALGERYPEHGRFGHGRMSLAFLSRIGPVEVRPVYPAGAPWYLETTIAFAGAPLTITNVHLSAKMAYSGRLWWGYEDLMRLAAEIGSSPSGLLVGDLNLTELTETHERIAALGLVDSFPEAGSGPGFTFPVFGRYHGFPVPPIARIDYVWHTQDLVCLRAEVGPDARSDHHGVVAVLARR